MSDEPPLTPDELRPRQREAVLLLWNGLAPKQVASVMRISPLTLKTYVCEVGRRLGGTCSPLQRIMLWQSELLRANPTYFALSAPSAAPTLTAHAPTTEPSEGSMR